MKMNNGRPAKKKSKYTYLGVALGVLLAVGAFVVFRNAGQSEDAAYEFHTVGRGVIARTVTGTGRVAPVDEEVVFAPSGGQVVELAVALGDTVTKGQVLLRMGDGKSITAPRHGEVTLLLVRRNEWVNPGARLVEITDFAKLEITAQVDELDIAKLQHGQSATVDIIALRDEEITGGITSIAREGVLSGGITTFAVKVSLPNPEGLLVGMSAEIRVETARASDVLVVPIVAVFYEEEKPLVFVQNAEGRLERRSVVIGLSDGRQVEVTSGLNEGEVVGFAKPEPPETPGMPGPMRGQR